MDNSNILYFINHCYKVVHNQRMPLAKRAHAHRVLIRVFGPRWPLLTPNMV